MGIHKYQQYIKGECVGKKFLKEQVDERKEQTQRENRIVEALCDALVLKPDISEQDLFKIAKHVDRIVNSERMRSEGEQKHDLKYRHLFNHSAEPFSILGINPCAYKLDARKVVQNSRPFTD